MSNTQPDFTARDQYAAQLNNVAGSQYNAYLHTVVQQRESFLREVAATRTRARRLIWLGLFLIVGGAVAFAIPLIRFLSRVDHEANSPSLSEPDLSPWSINGVPVGLFGWAAAGIGSILLVVGIVLHVVATSRRRRVMQQLPIAPPPWPTYGSQQPPTAYHRR